MKKALERLIFLFIFSVLSFGRAASLLHIGPIYLTEIVLLLGIPLIYYDRKKFFLLPRSFLLAILAFFVMGCLYFVKALFARNVLAFRDTVYFSYILFFLIAFILFSDKKKFKIFLSILIISTIIRVIIVRICIYRAPWIPINNLFGEIKGFNYTLYFTISLSYFIAVFNSSARARYKIIIAVFSALSIYILFLWGIRSSWLALAGMILFHMTQLRFYKKILLKFCAYFFISLIIILALFLNGRDFESINRNVLQGKFMSLKVFFKKDLIKTNSGSNAASTVASSNSASTAASSNNTTSNAAASKITFSNAASTAVSSDAVRLDSVPHPYSKVYLEDPGHAGKNSANPYIMNLCNIVWRSILWQRVVMFGLESCIFGKGFGVSPVPIIGAQDKRVIMGSKIRILPAHNHVIAIFYKMGIFGLVLFFFINIYSFLYGLNYLKLAKDGLNRAILLGSLGSFISWHITAFFFDVIESPPTSIFLWIIIGLIFASVNVDNEKNPG